MASVERLEAELALARLEEEFVDAKADGKDTPELRASLRAAREEFRGTYRPVVAVQPDSVGAVAAVKKAGGK